MIREKNTSIFQFGNNDEFPEPILQEELQELKIEKLSNRVTLLTILIPFMIGIIIVIAYLDIKNRVTRTHNTEATSIERISKDLETKFSFLSLEQAKIKDIHSKKMPSFEKSIDVLQSSREEMSQAIESLNGKNQKLSDSMMVESDSMKVEIEALKDIGNHMAKDAEDVSSNLYALTEILTETKDNLDRLNADILILSEEKIGKEELDLALKLKEISNRQELLEIKTTLDRKIDNLNRQPNNFQSNIGQIVAVQTIKGSKQSKEKPVQPEINPTAMPRTVKSEEQATMPSPSTTDGIEEQNIN